MSRAFRLGVFIVMALAILATGIFLIGDKQLLFTSTYSLKVAFPTVAGLNDGAEVRVGGIQKGTVKQIQLPTQPDGKVTVVMDLAKSTRDVIKKDSVASIQTEGLLGSKFIEVSFGSKDAPKVKSGDTIGGQPPIDISQLIDKTNKILDSTQETMSNVSATTDNLKSMSAKINDGKGTVGALINDKSVFEQLNATTEQAKAGATAFHENMEALKSNFFLRGFFNRRGYKDTTELTKHEIAYLPEGSSIKRFAFETKQLFDQPDKTKLKNEKALNEVGHFLEANKFGLAVAVATSGMTGDSDKDLSLTRAQAWSVRDYLVKNFKMDDTRFKTIGLGKNKQNSAEEPNTIAIIVYSVGSSMPPAADLASSKPSSQK